MKILKRFFCLFLSLGLVLSFYPDNINAESKSYTDSIINKVIKETSKGDLRRLNNYGESEKTTLMETVYKTYSVIPDGQPINGYSFSPKGGLIPFSASGSINVGISIGFSTGLYTATINVGYSSTGQDILVEVPGDGHSYKVKFYFTVRAKKFRHDRYKYGVFQYSYYTYTTEDFHKHFAAERV